MTIWVWITKAHNLPSPRVMRVCHTMVERPRCSGVHSARAVSPTGMAAKKFVLLSMVAVRPPGGRTATIESKTNFFAAIPVGDTAYAECTPLHRGRSTMVWQTRITRGDGRLCALVIQTQIVIPPQKS